MEIERIERDATCYRGEICESIAAYYLSMEPQPEKVVPVTLPGYIPISLSPEGRLVSIEFLDLHKTRGTLPRFNPAELVRATPIFKLPSTTGRYDWSCSRAEDVFVIHFRRATPHVEYRVGRVSFYCNGVELVAVEARACEITE